jgi:chlorophyllide a reductase subunit Y
MVINAALANRSRFAAMNAFFEGVGTEDTAGVWEETPQPRPEFKAKYAKALAASKAAEEAVGT